MRQKGRIRLKRLWRGRAIWQPRCMRRVGVRRYFPRTSVTTNKIHSTRLISMTRYRWRAVLETSSASLTTRRRSIRTPRVPVSQSTLAVYSNAKTTTLNNWMSYKSIKRSSEGQNYYMELRTSVKWSVKRHKAHSSTRMIFAATLTMITEASRSPKKTKQWPKTRRWTFATASKPRTSSSAWTVSGRQHLTLPFYLSSATPASPPSLISHSRFSQESSLLL